MTDDDCDCIAAHTEACQDARVAKIEAELDRYRAALEDISTDCGADDWENVVEELQNIALEALEAKQDD